MANVHHVVLIPGFFGFGNLGDLRYFLGVREALERAFLAHDVDVAVHEVQTLPTGSIRQRSARLLETLASLPGGDEPIHLIGHSTGGLDARLAVAPTASLPVNPEIDALKIYQRVSTIVSVSTPHYGTPLAGFFGSTMGRPLLGVLATAFVVLLRRGKLPLSAALKLGELVARFDNVLGQRRTILDEVYQHLLSDFGTRRQEIIDYLEAVSSDQSLIFQLTAAGCDVLNAATGDPDQARYGCVVTRSPAPRLRHMLGLRQRDVYARAMHGVYAALYTIAARSAETWLPLLAPLQELRLRELFGDVPSLEANDGIVPTRSQVWGEVIDAVESDHLDLVGHYGHHGEAVASDWLPSGSGFSSEVFERTWSKVADFVVHQAHAPERARLRSETYPPLQPAAADPIAALT